jgi:hypothetical protein
MTKESPINAKMRFRFFGEKMKRETKHQEE